VPGNDEGDRFYQIRQNAVVKEKSITVYYPHHPYYGKTLPAVEIHRNSNPPGYICRASDIVLSKNQIKLSYTDTSLYFSCPKAIIGRDEVFCEASM
jgi:hypothetical protein